MNKGPFKVYIDRLKSDETEKILEVVSPAFLEIEEKELSFIGEVTVSGKAYLAKDHLILELKIEAKAQMPCSVCNESTLVTVESNDYTHIKETSEISSSVYDYSNEVRSAILLKIPPFFECNHGHCPQRKDLHKYRAKSSPETHNPFSDLSI
ncbi:MAG: hypothetical protein KR126chlam1_00205 [Chlamydiae bacterium]|nr:hypothetical protein [Chlamydiota bacterium]